MAANAPVMPVDTPGEYAQGLLKRLGGQDPLAVLGELGAAVRRAFEGMAGDAIRRPEAPGKWSMIEVAHHLADSDLVVGFRLRGASLRTGLQSPHHGYLPRRPPADPPRSRRVRPDP